MGGSYQLILAGPHGSRPKALTPGRPATDQSHEFANQGVFSPDGRHIAYTQSSGPDVHDQLSTSTSGSWTPTAATLAT